MSEFKHMMPDEATVWSRWLALANLPEDAAITYDVTVGEEVRLPEDFPEPYSAMAKFLSKKRIDAVITLPNVIIIVEVKKVVNWPSIGQMLGYPILFEIEFLPELPLAALLVAESFPLDLRTIYDALQLHYDLVPPGATAIESSASQTPQPPPPTETG